MSMFTKTTLAKKPKTRESEAAAYIYSAILIVMVLCQLFNFNDFLTLLESFWLPGGTTAAYLLGGAIVVSEVFALPFLLGMKLSPLMRIISMILGWIVPLKWLGLALWLNLTVNAVSNIGFLGTTFKIIPGWWAVTFCIGLILLTAWSSWGMWPIITKRHKKHKSK